MPFNPINFAGISPQGNSFLPENLIEQFMQGYKASQLPSQMRRQKEQEELANAFEKMKMQRYPEQARIEEALKEAQTQKLLRQSQSPFGEDYNLQGPARQAWDLKLLGQMLGKESEEYKLAEKLMQATQNRGFGSAPIRMQANVIDNIQKDNPDFTEEQARNAADQLLLGQRELPDGTEIKIGGLTNQALNSLVKYGTDAAQRNALISGEQAEAETEVMIPFIQKGIQPYGNTYFGKSPALIADIGKAKVGDEAAQKRIGEFLAARTLQLEWYQLQQRMQTGKVTVAATRELIERGVATIGGDFNSLTPESQKIAIDTVQEAVKKAYGARKEVGIGAWESLNRPKSEKKNEMIPPPFMNEPTAKKPKVYNPKTDKFE